MQKAMGDNTPSSSTSRQDAVPDPISALAAYLPALQGPLVSITRNASSLPGPSDLSFHRSIDRNIATALDQQAGDVQALTQSLTRWAKGKARATNPDEEEEDDPSSAYRRIADVVDGLLERADICLDQYSGKLAVPQQASDADGQTRLTAPTRQNNTTNNGTLPKNGKLPNDITNAQIDPPQRQFTLKPDNTPDTMWDRALAMGKPNALPPPSPNDSEASSTPTVPFEPGTIRQGMYCAEGDPRHNPYYREIFAAHPPPYIYQPPTEDEMQPPPPLDEALPAGVSGVPFYWIQDKAGIEQLSQHLQEDRVKEIAIDLEHHSYRSYQGIACLMQLSTQWGDYIIDLLSDDVRRSVEILNTSFTDPDKVKILHGAEHDVLWLQRDCGLYLVNLFDTYHATNVLPLAGHGLAFLLSRYYDFEADKRYQLADWRIRPLPKEMLYYARSDTHALIYIYHRLRSELLNAGGKIAIDEVMKRSKITAARRYAKEVWDQEGNSREGWRSMWRRMGGDEAKGTDLRPLVSQMNRTERLLRRMHLWRDRVAREEDESPKYILSAQNLIKLAERAPMTKSEAMACFSPGIPPVRKRAGEVARIVKEEVLAWEQDQKERQDAERAKLMDVDGAGAQAGQEGEDLGTTAVTEVSANTPSMSSLVEQTSASSSHTEPSTPVVAALWANGTAPGIKRHPVSHLLGSHPDAQRAQQQAAEKTHPLHQTLLHSLHTIVGKPRPSAPADEDVVDAPQAPPSRSSDDASASSAESSPSPEPADAEEITSPQDVQDDDDVVAVKKSKKPKWSREQKRKARSERSISNDVVAPPASNKKAKPDDGDTAVKPFDYSAQPSILDNPMALQSQDKKSSSGKDSSSSKNGKKKNKGKGADKTKDKDKNDPARFADRPAPRDRSEIKAGSKSFTFK